MTKTKLSLLCEKLKLDCDSGAFNEPHLSDIQHLLEAALKMHETLESISFDEINNGEGVFKDSYSSRLAKEAIDEVEKIL